jgi:superfamily II DNA or RNA helicase
MGISKILVLLPSLALVRQTLHEWLHETRLPLLAYLCVCSDCTVAADLDPIATPQSELDFEVTTDSRSVREFLEAPFAGVRVIFSTYQSVQRAIKPALRKSQRFDLGIFDEAHKTAGCEGRNFAFALDDKNLAIRKRLFLTATPRHYNPLRKDKEGDAQLVFSMDKPNVYGPQAYRLTFAEAARRGVICHYKVIISVITTGMVTNELLNRGEVLVNGDAVRARQVANQLALKDAIANYDVNKVFTFHSTVKSAASFTSDGPEGIATHLSAAAADVRLTPKRSQPSTIKSQPISQSLVTSSATSEFKTFHVNGTMRTALRERVMRGFRECARGIISNARCLTEGVDVPAVDMVAFLSPRRSRVDIVQAIGRAMRKPKDSDKTTGYVLVPIYREEAKDENIEAAVSRSEFDDVWNVLQSLQEQDEVLAEIIREMREERGRTKGFSDARFRERVEVLGPQISLADLRQALTTLCIERLADDWEERFGELRMFKERFGHCKVLDGWIENPRLARWVQKQRSNQKTLRENRRQRLDELGFLWNAKDAAWEQGFADLVEYKSRHGDCDVPVRSKGNFKLGRWVHVQRGAYKTGRLPHERVKRLEDLGFRWEPYGDWWDEWFAKLVEFKRGHDHCNVPRDWPKDPKLGLWVNSQRMARKRNELSNERVCRLNEHGFSWDPKTDLWEQRFSELVRFKNENGDCLVPSASPQYRKLSTWVSTQREFKKREKLDADRIRRLEEQGFVWNIKDAAWEAMSAELIKFWKAREDCNVPQGWPENPKLGAWVNTQRLFRKKGKVSRLTSERIKRLDALGFQWEVKRNRQELRLP